MTSLRVPPLMHRKSGFEAFSAIARAAANDSSFQERGGRLQALKETLKGAVSAPIPAYLKALMTLQYIVRSMFIVARKCRLNEGLTNDAKDTIVYLDAVVNDARTPHRDHSVVCGFLVSAGTARGERTLCVPS